VVLTSGCETISGILADLFGEPPAARAPTPATPLLADRVVVQINGCSTELVHDGTPFETFPIALGREGPKRKEGDGRTPEGLYHIDRVEAGTRPIRTVGELLTGSAHSMPGFAHCHI
jgi:hypothetical protein